MTRRLSPAERAQREAQALDLLRAGGTRSAAVAASRLAPTIVARIAREHGVPKLPPWRRTTEGRAREITRMTEAELDALEAQVAAGRRA